MEGAATTWRGIRLATQQAAFDQLQRLVDAFLQDRTDVTVLEAGCGSASHVDFGERAYVVGIDLSRRQLDRHPRLDERILGDIETYDFGSRAFDIAVCFDVLEHLADPRTALDRIGAATRPEGLIVLGFPNLLSVKGLVTKLTPHRAHVWAYRYLLRSTTAGTDDHGPFETHLHRSLTPNAVLRFAADRRLSVRYLVAYESELQAKIRQRTRGLKAMWTVAALAANVASAGRVRPEASDLIVVLQKR